MTKLSIFSSLYVKNIKVLEALLQRFPGSIIVSDKPHTEEEQQQILRAGGRVISIFNCLSADMLNSVQSDIAQRITKIKAIFATKTWENYCNKNNWTHDALASHAEAQIISVFSNHALLVAAIEQAHQRFNFNMVAVNEDWTASSRAIVSWAKKRKIASFHLMHGSALCTPFSVGRLLYSDCTAIFGERDLESFIDAGADANKIAICGNPLWDGYSALISRRQGIKNQILKKYNIPDEVPLVVFATTWVAFQSALECDLLMRRTTEAFVIACKALLNKGFNFQAVIKDRQNSFPFIQPLINELCILHGVPSENILHVTDDAKDWVIAANVLISVDSSISVEAMIAGTPAINLIDPSLIRFGPCFDVDSGVIEVAVDELHLAIFELLTNQELRTAMLAAASQSVSRYNLGIDGLATQRVAELMGRLATQHLAP